MGQAQAKPVAQDRRDAGAVFGEERHKMVSDLSLKVFGKLPKRVAFPGGESRAAFVVDMGHAVFVFARREDKADAQLEGIVLRTLGPTGFVPNLRAISEDWIVQEFIEGTRVPVMLDQAADEATRMQLINGCLQSLVGIHDAAHTMNLRHRMPKLGVAENWLWNRTGAAKRISNAAGMKAPDLDREALVRLMEVKRDEFIKWDARPGNAMVATDRTVWFDWEDCGRSKTLDDMAFVLCDEWTALEEKTVQTLKAGWFKSFNRSLSADHGMDYLHHFGVCHMVLRLRSALKLFHRKDEWWDRDYCLQGDKVGVTPQETGRLVLRLKVWAGDATLFRPLLPWLDDVAARYDIG
ncbi:MAG: hypothetical protein AAF903_15375 [Pseudomonadota bacterium]